MQYLVDKLSEQGYRFYPASVKNLPDGGRLFVVGKGAQKLIGVDGGINLGVPIAEISGAKLYRVSWGIYTKVSEMIDLKPKRCVKKMSFGTGDRLGMATAAHVNTVGASQAFPVIAQQSPRELGLTNRSFKQVFRDAAMGLLETGYRGDWGADADHIKSEKDLDDAIEARYTMYTLDLSDWTTDTSATGSDQAIAFNSLSCMSQAIIKDWADRQIDGIHFFKDELIQSACIYEKALQQVEKYNSKLAARLEDYDLEISIDEGTRLTTMADHLFVAEYLHRSSVPLFSLAPRFPGEFQKGIDYVGDIDDLQRSFESHTAIALKLGKYRLSLHSGSDKFSVYRNFSRATGGHFHVKTSGTSWLQAVGTVAVNDRELFAKLYKTCIENLNDNRKLYHVFITEDDFPADLPQDIASFYQQNNVRQLFHISYGSLLDAFGNQLKQSLADVEEQHYANVRAHIQQHLEKLEGS